MLVVVVVSGGQVDDTEYHNINIDIIHWTPDTMYQYREATYC